MNSAMDSNQRQNDQLQQVALRLIRCMGSQAALSCCRDNQWQGLYEAIEALEGRPLESHHAA